MKTDDLKNMLLSLSFAEHMGDVNNTLEFYAPKLGIEPSEWDDERERMVWSWEELEPLED